METDKFSETFSHEETDEEDDIFQDLILSLNAENIINKLEFNLNFK